MQKSSIILKSTLALALLLAPLAGRGQPQGWHYNAGGRLLGVKSRGNNIWVVGAQGLILHSTDRGDTWNIRESGLTTDLRGVSFPDDTHGWAVGDYGYVLRTTDGGFNWQQQTQLNTPWGWGVCFVDTAHGWICGPTDTVYKTIDGGASWTKHPMNRINHGTSICFSDSMHGFMPIDNGNGTIMKTTNGGLTWVLKANGGEYLDMLDSLRGWGAGSPGIVKTTNGWESGTVQYTGPTNFTSVSIGDSVTIWTVGSIWTGDIAAIIATTNSGISWAVDTNRTRDNYYYSIDGHLQLNNVTVVGNGGAIVRSTDAGTTWRVFRNADIKDRSFYNTAFYNSQNGWAVGTYGVIAHTTNGGTIWQRQVSGLFSFLYGVDFPDSLIGKICTGGGGVLGTRDGGNTWVGESTGTTYPLFSINLVDTAYGVAVGGYYGPPEPPKGEGHGGMGAWEHGGQGDKETRRQGAEKDTLKPWGTGLDFWKYPWKPWETALTTPYRAITRTTNGGALWIAVNSTGQVPLYGVSFVSPREGWACGDPQGGMGVILHTADSGATWTGQSSNVNQTLNWIQFKDRLNGWCVGGGGATLWTTDGGNTWNQGNSGTTAFLWSCAFYDALHGFACANNGLLIKTTDGGRNWTPDTSKVYANLMAVNALDSLHAWTVGSYGMVLGWRLAGVSGVETRGQGDRETRGKVSIKAWPNPFVSYARVPGHERERFALYDITGRRVGTYRGDRIGADAMAGVYFLMAEGKETGPVRIVKIK